MQRLVYSPRVEAFVKSDSGIYELSPYITNFSVERKVNQVSSASLTFRNPDMMWTEHKNADGSVGPVFHPMDPIIISLTRLRNRPLQVFTGYCDSTPYLQLFPGLCTIRASCTLKRLLYTYWDPGLPFVWEFLAEHGWQVAAEWGGIINARAEAERANQQGPRRDDSGIGKLLHAVLTDVGGWKDEHIYIEKIPDELFNLLPYLFDTFKEDSIQASEEFKELLHSIIGSSSQGSGGGQGGNQGVTSGDIPADLQKYNKTYPRNGNETIPFNDVARIAESQGLPGITFAQIAIGESGLRPGAVSPDGGYGMWQMTPRVQSSATVQAWERLGSYFNPFVNARQALYLLGGSYSVSGARNNWYGVSHVTDWNKHWQTATTHG